MELHFNTDRTIQDCPELQQGLFSCAICYNIKKAKAESIILDGWRECCGKKMNLLPAGERLHKAKQHYGNHKLYITALDRS